VYIYPRPHLTHSIAQHNFYVIFSSVLYTIISRFASLCSRFPPHLPVNYPPIATRPSFWFCGIWFPPVLFLCYLMLSTRHARSHDVTHELDRFSFTPVHVYSHAWMFLSHMDVYNLITSNFMNYNGLFLFHTFSLSFG
jgi:hypothetical protein